MREIKEVSRAVAETDAWIDDLAERLGWRDRGKTYAALIGALHGPRDAPAARRGPGWIFLEVGWWPIICALEVGGALRGGATADLVAAFPDHLVVGRRGARPATCRR